MTKKVFFIFALLGSMLTQAGPVEDLKKAIEEQNVSEVKRLLSQF